MIQLFNRLFRRARDIGADEYEQLSILQRTNMSEVWLARRKGDGLITVTKIARVDKPKYIKANQEAILNESRWLQKFQNDPRIVQLYRTGETTLEGSPRFIAAEYLAGGTVEDLLEQSSLLGRINSLFLALLFMGQKTDSQGGKPNLLRFLGISKKWLYKGAIPVEQALEIIQYIAEGLDHMHRKGVVHRDIKPDNIMFRRRPRHGQPISADNLVLIDLGITTEHNRVAGAAIARGWSEPHRIRAREARKALVVKNGFDVYCLGQVLRYLLTREKPHNTGPANMSQGHAESADSGTLTPAHINLPMAIPPKRLRLRANLEVDALIDLADALTALINDCLNPDIEARPAAREVILRADQILRILNQSRRLLGGPIISKSSEFGSNYSHISQPYMPSSPKGSRASKGRLAGAVAVMALGIMLSLWVWQNDPKALTDIIRPVGLFANGMGSQQAEITEPQGLGNREENTIEQDTQTAGQPGSDISNAGQDVQGSVSEESGGLTGVVATVSISNSNSIGNASIGSASTGNASTGNSNTDNDNSDRDGSSTGVDQKPQTELAQSSQKNIPQVTRKPNPTVQPTSIERPTEIPTQPPSPTAMPSPTRKAQPVQIQPTPLGVPQANTPTSPGLQQGSQQQGSQQQGSQQQGSQQQASIQQPQSAPKLGPIPGLGAIVSQTSNACRSDALDTWDERVELQWVLEPAGVTLPPEYAQEVVVWRPGADPMDPNQAFTIHGREEIIPQEGGFILHRKPKTLVPAVIVRNEEYMWGVMLVNRQSGARYQRLTPTDCRFRPAGRLFGDGQNGTGGGQ